MIARPIPFIASIVLFAAVAAPLSAALEKGAVAPDITSSVTWNANGKSKLSDFRGEYTQLVFWGVWCGWCVKEFPEHMRQAAKYGDQGFNVVCIAAEPKDSKATIDGFLAKDQYKSSTQFIGLTGQSDIGPYGIKGWPTVYVLDTEGKVVLTGNDARHITDQKIEELVATLGPKKLPRAVDKAVQKAATAYDGAEYAKADAEADKVLADGKASETAKADANYVKENIIKVAATAKGRMESAAKDREYLKLQKLVDNYRKPFKGHALEAAIKEHDKVLKSKEGQKEIKALTAFEDLKKRYEDADGGAVVKAEVEAFIKKNEGTKAAEKAKALIAEK